MTFRRSPDAIVLVRKVEDISVEALTGKQQVQLLVVVLSFIRLQSKNIKCGNISPQVLGTSKLFLGISVSYKLGLTALKKPVGSPAGFAQG
jgi:hypothetical protein